MGWLQFLAGMFIKHSTVIYLVPSMLTVNATQFINGNILTWGGGRKESYLHLTAFLLQMLEENVLFFFG